MLASDFVRIVYNVIAQIKTVDDSLRKKFFEAVFFTLLYKELERVHGYKKREELLILIDKYLSTDMSTKEFARSLYKFYPLPKRGLKFLNLRYFLNWLGTNNVKLPNVKKVRKS